MIVLVPVSGGDDVKVVGAAAAGQSRIAALAVERVGAEHPGRVRRHALSLVGGDCIAVVQVAGIQVLGGEQHNVTAAVNAHGDAALGGVDRRDRCTGPVGHAETSIVAQADDPIADLEVPSRDF